MIKGNRLEFGYGDICVSSGAFSRMITFQSFAPPAKVGDTVSEDVEYYDDAISLKLSLSDGYELLELLKCVKNELNLVFTFKELIFDFSNYNEKSVNICLRNVKNTISANTFLLAC